MTPTDCGRVDFYNQADAGRKLNSPPRAWRKVIQLKKNQSLLRKEKGKYVKTTDII
jgi:hypothetical protein